MLSVLVLIFWLYENVIARIEIAEQNYSRRRIMTQSRILRNSRETRVHTRRIYARVVLEMGTFDLVTANRRKIVGVLKYETLHGSPCFARIAKQIAAKI